MENLAISINDYKANLRISSREYTPRQECATEELNTQTDKTVGYIRFQNNNPSVKNAGMVNS